MGPMTGMHGTSLKHLQQLISSLPEWRRKKAVMIQMWSDNPFGVFVLGVIRQRSFEVDSSRA
jgi:hypothetical protein